MKKQFLILCIIIFVQLFALSSVHSINNSYKQERTNGELLSDIQGIEEVIIVSEIQQDLDYDKNNEKELLRSNDYLPIPDNDQKFSKITTTASSDAFISLWDTTRVSSYSSNSSQIKLPLESSGNYNFIVNWGDNTSDLILSYNQTEVTHNFEIAGEYTLIINGTLKGWQFNNGGDKIKILEISQWGNLNLGNSGSYFYGCENLELTAIDTPDLNGTTTLYYAFRNCKNLGSEGNMNLWNVSSVTDMSFMFLYATSFNQSISNWDVSNVTDMGSMFEGAHSFNQSIGNWDVSNVINMYGMFNYADSFNQPINNWNVSSVIRTSFMFCGATSFNQPIGDCMYPI